jgi:hypothetical protein
MVQTVEESYVNLVYNFENMKGWHLDYEDGLCS